MFFSTEFTLSFSHIALWGPLFLSKICPKTTTFYLYINFYQLLTKKHYKYNEKFASVDKSF